MHIKILNRWGYYPPTSKDCVFLTWDNWNDYSFYTTFGIFYVDENSRKHELGGVHLGFTGQKELDRVYNEGYEFDYIGDTYFSLGTSEQYYEELRKLADDIREDILASLNDIARNDQIFRNVINEPVVQQSFFRSLSPTTVTGQYRRIALGGAKLTPYSFAFNLRAASTAEIPFGLTFEVLPDSFPPTNIHVLIGRNGVGKTHLINGMIDSLTLKGSTKNDSARFSFLDQGEEGGNGNANFANLIFVSFSAFDEVDPWPEETPFIGNLKYSYIGLKLNGTQTEVPKIKDPSMLPKEFLDSFHVCKARSLNYRWLQAISILQSDPYFRQAGIVELMEAQSSRDWQANVLKTFRRLSSGHKIVLLTITKLIEKLQERSLVIMDEPEAHLHPPLLSAFIRTVSELLIRTNGVAIVATHSPVILQEVPRSCVVSTQESTSWHLGIFCYKILRQ